MQYSKNCTQISITKELQNISFFPQIMMVSHYTLIYMFTNIDCGCTAFLLHVPYNAKGTVLFVGGEVIDVINKCAGFSPFFYSFKFMSNILPVPVYFSVKYLFN